MLKPIEEVGDGRLTSVKGTYSEIQSLIGFAPNATHLDDPDKVLASWGFADDSGRKGFIWCYKVSPDSCSSWSADGDLDLLKEVFGDRLANSRRF